MNVLSLAEVARRAGCARSHVYRLIKSGELRARKLRRSTVVLEDDFNAFLKNLPDAVESGAILPDRQRASS
jgi:excisionase family DNA binding protein